MRQRRRILPAALLVLLIIGAAVVGLIQSIRNAPLEIGSSGTASGADSTPETGGELLPFGTPGRDIAFMSNRDGTWDIFLLSGDGTLKNLTTGTDNDAAFDYFPSWAMDGQQINFLSNRLKSDEMGPSQVNTDGTGLQNLDVLSAIMSLAMSRRFDWDPAWSPGGKQLLWASLRDFNLELYLIDTGKTFDISSARNLTNSGARDWFAAWSPDGAQFTYASDAAGNEDIYRLNVSGDAPVQLTDSMWDELRALWSQSGDTLLYLTDEDDALLQGNVTLYKMGIDGSNKHPVGDESFEGGAVWSPDGSQVAYMSNAGGEWHILVMNADGSGKRRITEPGADYLYPVWRP